MGKKINLKDLYLERIIELEKEIDNNIGDTRSKRGTKQLNETLLANYERENNRAGYKYTNQSDA
jgi:hypothetical protein